MNGVELIKSSWIISRVFVLIFILAVPCLALDPKLLEHLKQSRVHLDSPAESHCIILGNEAADLDSVASAITLSYFLSSSPGTFSQSPSFCSPVINIPRRDICLRPDILYVLDQSQIPLDLLVFKDELQQLLPEYTNSVSLVLVDHNRLAIDQDHLFGSIIGIIDHHFNENMYLSHQLVFDKIFPVGSTCSIITEMMRNSDFHISKELNYLLVSTILLDTKNFNSNIQKFSLMDQESFEFLSNSSAPIPTLYQTLLSLRTNVHEFSLEQLLVKDLKNRKVGSSKFAVSSIGGTNFHSLSQRLGILEQICSFAKKRNVNLYCIFGDDGHRKDLVCLSVDRPLTERIIQNMESSGMLLTIKSPGTNYARIEIGNHEVDSLVHFNLNPTASRKSLSPFLQTALL